MPLIPNHLRDKSIVEHVKESLSSKSAQQPFSGEFLVLTCLLSYLMTLVLLSQWGKEKFEEIAARPNDLLESWEFELVETFKDEVRQGKEYKAIFNILDDIIEQNGEKFPKFKDLFSGPNDMFELDLLFDIDGLAIEPTHLRSMDLTFHLKVPYPVRIYIDPSNNDEIERLVSWIDTIKTWLADPTTKLPRPESNYIPVYTT